uniref:Secreted protein n=1 Tax=Trichogramma kaykai TaxID=54128 RepID=A0ABD2WK48_9HYME
MKRLGALLCIICIQNRSNFLNYANAAPIYYYILHQPARARDTPLPLFNIFKINFKFSKRQRVRQQQQQQQQQQCIESGSI